MPTCLGGSNRGTPLGFKQTDKQKQQHTKQRVTSSWAQFINQYHQKLMRGYFPWMVPPTTCGYIAIMIQWRCGFPLFLGRSTLNGDCIRMLSCCLGLDSHMSSLTLLIFGWCYFVLGWRLITNATLIMLGRRSYLFGRAKNSKGSSCFLGGSFDIRLAWMYVQMSPTPACSRYAKHAKTNTKTETHQRASALKKDPTRIGGKGCGGGWWVSCGKKSGKRRKGEKAEEEVTGGGQRRRKRGT